MSPLQNGHAPESSSLGVCAGAEDDFFGLGFDFFGFDSVVCGGGGAAAVAASALPSTVIMSIIDPAPSSSSTLAEAAMRARNAARRRRFNLFFFCGASCVGGGTAPAEPLRPRDATVQPALRSSVSNCRNDFPLTFC